MKPHSLLLALALCLAASCGKRSTLPGRFLIVSDPPQTISHQDQLFFQFAVAGDPGPVIYQLLEGPAGLTVDTAGLLHWRPEYSSLGTHRVRVRARSGNERADLDFDLRVSQGFQMGVSLSPRGHVNAVTQQDRIDQFTQHEDYGHMISFSGPWRDSHEADGEVPQFVRDAHVAALQFDFHPAIALTWTNSAGVPDLFSESDLGNNSWTNPETRAEFLAVVQRVASTVRPLYLSLGYETNVYYLTHSQAEWDAWLSVLQACNAIVHAVSPDTIVYTVFQLERMKGLGARAGWSDAPHFQLVDELRNGGYVDAVGFSTYPFLEFADPADIPLAYYDEIKQHWNKQVLFSALGWPAADSGPVSGSETQQMNFLQLFLDRVQDVPVEYTSWRFVHDPDDSTPEVSMRRIGMRTNDGSVVRPLDTMWRDAVLLRQR